MLVGIDEVGRGCLAGPVVVGAVILKQPIEGLKDSKLLTKKQREGFVSRIEAMALAFGLGWVEPVVIDEIGLTAAVRLAMEQALEQIQVAYDEIIIDGNYNFLSHLPRTKSIIKADMTVPAVSAASIIAKVARDHYMANLGSKYEHYEFDRHVGYGTALHLERLRLHGVSDQHRRSFAPVAALLQ